MFLSCIFSYLLYSPHGHIGRQILARGLTWFGLNFEPVSTDVKLLVLVISRVTHRSLKLASDYITPVILISCSYI